MTRGLPRLCCCGGRGGTSRDGPGSCRGWSAGSSSPQRPQTGGHPLLHPCNSPKAMGTQFVMPTEPPNWGAPSSPSPQRPQNWGHLVLHPHGAAKSRGTRFPIPVVPQNQGRVARGGTPVTQRPAQPRSPRAGGSPVPAARCPVSPTPTKRPKAAPTLLLSSTHRLPAPGATSSKGPLIPGSLARPRAPQGHSGVGINPLPDVFLGTEPTSAPALGRCPGADGWSPPGFSAPQQPGTVSEPRATQILAVPHPSSAGSCRVGCWVLHASAAWAWVLLHSCPIAPSRANSTHLCPQHPAVPSNIQLC